MITWPLREADLISTQWVRHDSLIPGGLHPMGTRKVRLKLTNLSDVTTSQDISVTLRTQSPHTHVHTQKPSVYMYGNHPDRVQEILMTSITLYTHTQTIKWSLLEGLRWCVKGRNGVRNVNNWQGGGHPPLHKHPPFPIGH